jgi:AcrR family transcriptional regulator
MPLTDALARRESVRSLAGIVRLRDRREALTLRTILTAARGLFAEHGYARTPIRLIAREAGVAPQTIYAHLGSKAGVLAGLVDLLDDEAGIPDLVAEAEAVDDPAELLGLLARAARWLKRTLVTALLCPQEF